MATHRHAFNERRPAGEGVLEPGWSCACGLIVFDLRNLEGAWEIEGVNDGYEGELPTLAEIRDERRRFGRRRRVR